MNHKSLICGLSELPLSELKVIWTVVQFIFIAIFGVILYYLTQRGKGIIARYQLCFIALSIFSVIFLCRLLDIVRYECNPDESEWIFQANGLVMNPGVWLKYFLPEYAFRVFTIIPLAVISIFDIPATGYAESRILTFILWTCFLVFFLAASSRLFNKRISLIITFLLTILISLSSQNDAVAYNSELPVITILMMGFYLFTLILTDEKTRGYVPVLLGFILVIDLFAKEQALFITFFFEIFLIGILIWSKKWPKIALLAIGNTVGLATCLLPYIFYGTLDRLLNRVISIISYSKYGLVSSKRVDSLSFLLVKFMNLLRAHDFRIIIFFALASLMFGLWVMFRHKSQPVRNHIIVFAFIFIIYFLTAYSIYSPHNFFTHYDILFYFPGSISLAFGLYYLEESLRNDRYFYTTSFLLVLFFFISQKIQSRSLFAEDVDSIYCSCGKKMRYDSVLQTNVMSPVLKKLSKKGDRMMVWGWRTSYYVENGLLPGSVQPHIQFLNPNYRNRDLAEKMFGTDIIKFKPKFFLELVGPSQFYSKDTSIYGVNHFPTIDSIIKENYHLVSVIGEEKLYLLNK